MCKRIKDILKNNYIYIIIFAIFYVIAWCTPLTGDDWLNWGAASKDIRSMVRGTIRYYNSWGGRVGSSLAVLFLTQYKWLWNICSGLVIAVMAWSAAKIVKAKNKGLIAIAFTLLILLTNMRMIAECYLWMAGNITYTYCFAMLLVYIVYIIYKEENKLNFKIYEYIAFGILNLFMSTFVENIAVGIVVANIIVLIYRSIKNKKVSLFYSLTTILSIIGLAIQLLSPGTRSRIEVIDGDFSRLSIFDKIITNIPNFVKFTYIYNPIMILVLIIALNKLIITKEKNNIFKIGLGLFINIVPSMTLLSNLYRILPFNINMFEWLDKKIIFINNVDNIYILIYWILFTLVTIYLIIKYNDKKNRWELLYIYIIGMVCVGAMMITTVWNARAAFATMMCIYLISLKILFETENKKLSTLIKCFLIISFILLTIVFLIIYNSVRLNVNDRNSYIKEQFKMGKKQINYYKVPDKLLVTEFPNSKMYTGSFNYYFGVDSDVIYKECKAIWKYQLFYERLY